MGAVVAEAMTSEDKQSPYIPNKTESVNLLIFRRMDSTARSIFIIPGG
jgi:hypothetical protein